MRRCLACLIMLGLLISVLPACASGLPEKGNAFPEITFELWDGSAASLNDLLSGRGCVVIDLWATWCSWCIREFPALQECFEAYGDRAAFLCLSADDTAEQIGAFRAEQGLTLPMGRDTAGITAAYARAGIPTMLVIDRFGNLAFTHTGAVTDPGALSRLLDFYLSDDYSGTVVLDGIPDPIPPADPDPEQLTASICRDAGITAACVEGTWPFLPGEEGAAASNVRAPSTEAAMRVSVTAAEGDVLCFSWRTETESVWDPLEVILDGRTVRTLSGTVSGREALALNEGDHELMFRYTKDHSAAEEYEDLVVISDVRLLSGREAEQALEERTERPHALEGSAFETKILNPAARRVIMYDAAGLETDVFGTNELWMIPDASAELKVRIGTDLSADLAFVFDNAMYDYRILSTCPDDGEGYLVSLPLPAEEETQYGYSVIYTVPDPSDSSVFSVLLVFPSPEALNALCDALEAQLGSPFGWGLAPLPAAEQGILITDPEGMPVGDVSLSVCYDTRCVNVRTGESGRILPEGDAASVHILTVPVGFEPDDAEYLYSGDELVIVLRRVSE